MNAVATDDREVSGARHGRPMFVSDFEYLSLPFEDTARLLCDPKGPWIETACAAAARRGLALTVAFPRRRSSVVTVSLRLASLPGERSFPAVDADIELDGGGEGCRISLVGWYRLEEAPAEGSGPLTAQRDVEETARSLLAGVAGALHASEGRPRGPLP